MNPLARAALNRRSISDLIIFEWRLGHDTMTIATKIRTRLVEERCRSLPSDNEAQAHAHNVLALYRDTVHALRQREATHA